MNKKIPVLHQLINISVMFFLVLIMCCQLLTRLGLLVQKQRNNSLIVFANFGNAAAIAFLIYYSFLTHWYIGIILLNAGIAALALTNFCLKDYFLKQNFQNFYYNVSLKACTIISAFLMFALA